MLESRLVQREIFKRKWLDVKWNNGSGVPRLDPTQLSFQPVKRKTYVAKESLCKCNSVHPKQAVELGNINHRVPWFWL